ncbi:MAG TPA: MTH1187 family thiamine-binding protein [Candidatus Competibacter sp.]|nr:hypothetical protein [Candidatus Competibacteraceae bacterium]HRC73743.1 MTH1187 family thiamine-binding protein [Candidatus Competibacter sp.]
MVLLEFQMAPHTVEEGVSRYVAQILDIVDQSGLPYQLTPMGTILEGEWDEVMAVVGRCFKHLAERHSRVGTHIKVDYRAGPAGRLKSKIESVERKLGRKLAT